MLATSEAVEFNFGLHSGCRWIKSKFLCKSDLWGWLCTLFLASVQKECDCVWTGPHYWSHVTSCCSNIVHHGRVVCVISLRQTATLYTACSLDWMELQYLPTHWWGNEIPPLSRDLWFPLLLSAPSRYGSSPPMVLSSLAIGSCIG